MKTLLTIFCLRLCYHASAQDAYYWSNKRKFDLNKNAAEYVIRSSGAVHDHLTSNKAHWTATTINTQLPHFKGDCPDLAN